MIDLDGLEREWLHIQAAAPKGDGRIAVIILALIAELRAARKVVEAAKCVVALWDDPCPYDAATTRGAFRLALAALATTDGGDSE